MQKDLISIIIPVYNGEEYIAQLIERILNNPYKNIEILIADDASTDSTSKILSNYASHSQVRYFSSPVNMGSGAARNKLLEMAKGEFIALQDVDDSFHPDRFINQLNFLKENVDIGGVGSNALLISKKNGLKWGEILRKENPKLIDWLTQSSMVHASLMLKKKSIANVRYREGINSGEDYYFMTELYFKNINLRNLPLPLYHYYVDETDLKTRVQRKFNELVFSVLIISKVVPIRLKAIFILINISKLSLGYLKGIF